MRSIRRTRGSLRSRFAGRSIADCPIPSLASTSSAGIAAGRRDRGQAPVSVEVGLEYLSLGPRFGHALRRRAAAGSTGGAARLGPGGGLHDPRRTDGRASSPRHRPTDRQHSTAARPGEQRAGRRARRVDDPGGRLGRGPGSGRWSRWRRGRGGRHARAVAERRTARSRPSTWAGASQLAPEQRATPRGQPGLDRDPRGDRSTT